MEDKLVTLAILTYAKAQILKNVLENEGIEAYIHNVNLIQPVISSGVRLRIKESDLPHALQIIESSAWLSEDIIKGKESSSERNKEKRKVLIPIDFQTILLKPANLVFLLLMLLIQKLCFYMLISVLFMCLQFLMELIISIFRSKEKNL